VLECVINVSEGRRAEVVAVIAEAAGDALLDVHTDAHHNRSVLTVVGEEPARAVAAAAVATIDLRHHAGVHPRIGAVDVVPFAPLAGGTLEAAIAARDRFARWAGQALALPCFHYGPERSLPDVRRQAFVRLPPDAGPARPHRTAGACAVGARRAMVAYNLWVATDLARAKVIAGGLRGPRVRALGLPVGDAVQVSMNLLSPEVVGPAAVYDLVAAQVPIVRAELVGLAPAAAVHRIGRRRWSELDLAEERTIEARLADRRRSP